MNPEIIGIFATCLVLISFLARNPRHIRIVNIIGAAIYCIYGYLIKSLSTVLLNGILIFVHICFLTKRK